MKEIKLTQGKVVFVDDDDFEELNSHKWFAHKHGHTFYARRNVRMPNGKQKTIRMHRVILNLTDSKILTDHKDGDGLNNQKSNLRIATYSQNNANKLPKQTAPSSKYLGVAWHKKINRWEVYISKDHKPHYIGVFKTETEAAMAYNNEALKHHGEFARLNKL